MMTLASAHTSASNNNPVALGKITEEGGEKTLSMTEEVANDNLS